MLSFSSFVKGSSDLQNLFIVRGIEISQTSYSSSEAKRVALKNARKRAFDIVVKRLLISSDVGNVILPDDYNVEKFIQTMKLNNEKTTSTSYSAKVDVQVNKNLVVDYLKNQGLKVLQDVPPSTVVIFKNAPEFVSEFNDMELGGVNVVPFIKGDGSANSYMGKADNVIEVYKNGSVVFSDKLLGLSGEFDTTRERFLSDLVLHINDAYKMSTSEGDFGKSVSMLIPIAGLSDWIQVEKIISKVSAIKSYEVEALKYNKAQVKLKYNYDLNSVVNALRMAGLDVQNKDTYLIVKR